MSTKRRVTQPAVQVMSLEDLWSWLAEHGDFVQAPSSDSLMWIHDGSPLPPDVAQAMISHGLIFTGFVTEPPSRRLAD